jgi:hypothetical protein
VLDAILFNLMNTELYNPQFFISLPLINHETFHFS